MSEILRLTYGLFPKTEKLRIRIGRWGRNILPAEELENLIQDETDQFQALARENRITGFTDPLFNWYDIFRPVSLISGGIELGPLTRYGETNTFYRLPEIRGPLSLQTRPDEYRELQENPPLPLYHVDQGDDQLAFLPGPVTFFHFCGNITGGTFQSFSEQLGKLYSQILPAFRFKKMLVFESVPLGEQDLSHFYRHVAPEKTVLFTTGEIRNQTLASAGEKFHSVVTDAESGNINASSNNSSVPGIALIDAHNTKLEDPAQVAQKLEEIGSRHNIGRLYLTHSDYLDFLPRQIAEKKLQLIGKVGE